MTGDTNKIKIFTEGIDSHSLAAYAFHSDKIDIDIDVTSAKSINRIKDEYPDLRQASKSSNFALLYGAGAKKLAKMLGCSLAEGQKKWDAYWELYSGIRDYGKKIVADGIANGYVTGYKGLKLRALNLSSRDEFIREKVQRVVINMSIQSHCILTAERAVIFQELVEKSGYTDRIRPFAAIHDAVYYLVRKDIETVKWFNDNFIPIYIADFMAEQPVHLTAEVDIGGNWKQQITLKNGASVDDIVEVFDKIDKENND